MRHGVKGRKLGRTSSHREAMFRNQLQSLVLNERIITTLPKAKELRPIAERVITKGKHGTIHDRRWVLRWVLSRDLVKKVFDVISPRFQERPGGYLRIVKLGPRQGDGTEMAVLELVEKSEETAATEEPKKAAKAPKKAAPRKEAKKDGDAEAKPKRVPKKEAAKPPKKDTKGEGKRVSTQKQGRAQTSTPKKSV